MSITIIYALMLMIKIIITTDIDKR